MSEEMKNLYRNSEGYFDPTAGKALGIAHKEELMNGYKDGDIVMVEMSGGGDTEVLLLRVHRTYATALRVCDTCPKENGLAIRSKAMEYIDGGRFQYVFPDKILSLVRSMTDKELDAVKKHVANVLNLSGIDAENTVAPAHDEEATKPAALDDETIQKIADAVASKIPAPGSSTQNDLTDHDELVRAKAERDVYKTYFTYQLGEGAAK